MAVSILLVLYVFAFVFVLIGRKGFRFRILGPTQKALMLVQNRVVNRDSGEALIRGPGPVYVPPGAGFLVVDSRPTVHKLEKRDYPIASGLNVNVTLLVEMQYTDPERVLYSAQGSSGRLSDPKTALLLAVESRVTEEFARTPDLETLRKGLKLLGNYVCQSLSNKGASYGVEIRNVSFTDYDEPPAAQAAAAERLAAQAEADRFRTEQGAEGKYYALHQTLDTLKDMKNLRVLGSGLETLLSAVLSDFEEDSTNGGTS